MSGILSYVKTAGLAAALVCGPAVLSQTARAHDWSQAGIRTAQQQLKDSGYYNGSVDGIDGPATRAAIRKYQADKNLTVNGRLDRETRSKLGVSNGTATTGEANRSAAEPQTGQPVANSASISAAQRSLQKKGFYKGNIDGNMGPETQAAIREYQKNSNLTVTGKLDQATLSGLGVSK